MSKILSLAKYGDLQPIFGGKTSTIVAQIVEEFERKSPDEMKRRFASSGQGGAVYLLEHPSHPGKIVEYVRGVSNDSISAMYVPHPIFASPGELLKAREDLIEQLETANHAAPGKLRVKDETRGRPIFLQEMSTAQLIDLVQRELIKSGRPATV